LLGQCVIFSAYENQLKAALRNARWVWSERERLAEQVTEQARLRFKNLLAKGSEPYATLRNLLSNEAAGSMPGKVADELEQRGVVSTARNKSALPPAGLPVQPLGVDVIEPVAAGVQALNERLARMEQHMLNTPQVQASAALEVSAQLRVNKAMFDRAKVLLEDGKLAAAQSHFETVVAELAPLTTEEAVNLRARAMANIGHCHHRQGRETEAIRLFRESFALAPTNVRLRVNAAVADLLEGKLAAAEAALRRLHEEFPQEDDVLELMAEAISQRGAPQEALTLLESSPASGEHHLCSLSDLRLKVGRNADAEQTAREAVSLFPKSHQAWFALGLSIAAPILNHEERVELLSIADRRRLKEAAEHLETASSIARSEEQRARLGMYMGNLCAVRSAIGEHDAALVAGQEAKGINPDDVFLLQNIFTAQLMAERYDAAAATAEAIGRQSPGPNAVARHMHALIGANRYDQALAAFETALPLCGVATDPRLLALRVECLRKLPDLDAAERALAEAYATLGRVTELLLQEARMRSAADQHELADRLFAEGERQASGRAQVVARRGYGLYLYRRRRWAEAAVRLVRGEEDPVASEVALEYLHCLFELNRMPEVVEHGSAIVAAGIFRAPIWELTAQALAALGRLKEAERLLRELVQHEPTEKQHLALAGICYRARGLNRAIKVLEAAQLRHPKSYYVQANLSGLYFARREYRKAFDAAKRAIEIAPKRQEGHTAMVRILGAGDGLVLTDGEKELLHASIARSKSVRQFQMKVDGDDIDLSEIIEVLKEQSAQAHQAMQVYREKRLPVTMLSQICGRSLIDTWLAISRSPTERFYVGSGVSEEQDAEQELAGSVAEVMLDASALLTLQALGRLKSLTKRFAKVHVATATFEKFSEELGKLRSFAASTGSLGYEEGRIQLIEVGPEVHVQKIAILDEIVSFLESDAVALEGLDAKSWADWQARKEPGLEAWIMHPLLMAKANSRALYCDEHGIRSLAQQSHGVRGFSTQALLRVLVDRAILDDGDYCRAVIKLVGMNFDFVSLSLNDFQRHLADSGYVRTEVFRKLLRQLQSSAYTDEKSAWILGGVMARLWFERSGDAHDRVEWIGLCLDSLNSAREPELAILQLLAAAGAQFSHFPEAFTALAHFCCDSPRLKPEHREIVGKLSFKIVELIAASSTRIPEPAVGARWNTMLTSLRRKRQVVANNQDE